MRDYYAVCVINGFMVYDEWSGCISCGSDDADCKAVALTNVGLGAEIRRRCRTMQISQETLTIIELSETERRELLRVLDQAYLRGEFSENQFDTLHQLRDLLRNLGEV